MDIKGRFDKPVRQWVKLAAWSVVYILFIIWVENLWWLLLLPFIFDLFITKFIPFDAWKRIENPRVRSIFSWIDAIVFALIAVYFINQFLFQNYQIPSSSLEQTLKVGDFLAVSKCAYGPRIPNTPLSFPLVQHTFPWGAKSYCDKPQWGYRRMKGYSTLKAGDIVVFNFPAGDTVPALCSNPDYYTLIFQLAQQNPRFAGFPSDSVMPYPLYRARMEEGARIIRQQEGRFGEILTRPVDRRENYVKRCVGLPGQTIQLRDNDLFVDGRLVEPAPGQQHNYFVQTNGTTFSAESLMKLGVSVSETSMVDGNQISAYLERIGMRPANNGGWGPVYVMAMTDEVLAKVQSMQVVTDVAVETILPEMRSALFPLAYSTVWTRDNYGPLTIPARGMTIALTEDNILRYEQCIVNYERNTLDFRDGVAYLNGAPATHYTFQMDYYWMLGDNRHNSADSRMWGFVPEDHIVGRPMFVWLSLDRDKSWFSGKIRWSRFGRDASR